ncbi:MAG: hypothetical protein RI973_2006 [Bacteroidota bacterium]|jgi:RND family efflux transporter MFP subunit
MKKTRVLIFLALLASCKEKEMPSSAPAETTAAAEEHPIHLTSAQLTQADLAFEELSSGKMSDELLCNASLVLHAEDKTLLGAFSDGVLSELRTTLNARVKKGQVLAVVRNPDLLDMQQEYLANQEQLVLLEQEFKRYETLQSADATAAKFFQKAQADLKAARNTQAVLAVKLRAYQMDPDKLSSRNLSAQMTLSAPTDGVVTQIFAGEGTVVSAGTPICEVAEMSKLHADLWVFEKDLPRIKQGQQVRISFPSDPAATFPAAIYSIDQVIDPEKKALRVHARLSGLASHSGFVDGAFVEARVLVGNSEGGILPEGAVVREGEGEFIFLVEREEAAGMTFKKVKVEKAASGKGMVAIRPLEPLPDPARIVTKGAYYVSAQGSGISAEE